VHACPARVNLADEVLIWRFPRDGLKDTLRHGGAADVAKADKQHRDLFRHFGGESDYILSKERLNIIK
jgi:hypothetical protein